jgi:hypothetical protein
VERGDGHVPGDGDVLPADVDGQLTAPVHRQVPTVAGPLHAPTTASCKRNKKKQAKKGMNVWRNTRMQNTNIIFVNLRERQRAKN